MLPKIAYHLMVVAIASHEILGKISQNGLYSHGSFTYSRKNGQLKMNNYVTLSGIDLNILYDRNNINNVINSEESSHWIKPRKRELQNNKQIAANPTVHENVSSKLFVDVDGIVSNAVATPKVDRSLLYLHAISTGIIYCFIRN